MDFFRQHILTIVTFWPLVGVAVLFLFNKQNASLIKWWANLVAIVAVFGGRYLVSDLLIWRPQLKPKLEVNVTE